MGEELQGSRWRAVRVVIGSSFVVKASHRPEDDGAAYRVCTTRVAPR